VAATQRMTYFMHVLELMSVAGRLPGSICSRPCRCRQRQPAHLSEIDEVLGGCRFTGRCPRAGWRGVAYTNVDTARRMGEAFSASDDRFVSCGRVEVLISRGQQIFTEAVARDLPWGPGAAPAPVRGPSEDVCP